MAGAVATVSRLLVGVGATLIGGVAYVNHRNQESNGENGDTSTTTKVIHALLDTAIKPPQGAKMIQNPQPLPAPPLNMTVHVPNPQQSSWTWTIVIASVGVGATAVIYYYSKDKIIHQKLSDIFAFQKKSNEEINDTIRNEVQTSTSAVQGTVENHVSQVKHQLNETDGKINGLQQTAQNIHDTAHRTHNEIHGLREDTNFYAQKMISNQNAHFSNIHNSLQYLSNQNMAVMGRLMHQIENNNNQLIHNVSMPALPAPMPTKQSSNLQHNQHAIAYEAPSLGKEFIQLSSPNNTNRPRSTRSQSYHNSPPFQSRYTNHQTNNNNNKNNNRGRHSHSGGHIRNHFQSNYDDSNDHGSTQPSQQNSKMYQQFRSMPQTPNGNRHQSHQNHQNQYYNNYYDDNMASPMSSIRRSSTIKKDTIVTTRELVEDFETSHSHTPSQHVLPNINNVNNPSNVELQHPLSHASKSNSPKGWNKWFSGL